VWLHAKKLAQSFSAERGGQLGSDLDI
jgi:hypothetical protein